MASPRVKPVIVGKPMIPSHIVALDIGGSHVAAGRVDVRRRAIARGSQHRHEADHHLSARELLDHWATIALLASNGPMPVAIAVPSPFDAQAGVSKMIHKFTALFGIQIREELLRRWSGTHLKGSAITFSNDGDAWAVGEAWSGQAQTYKRVIGITLGTGLGAGYVLNGVAVHDGPGIPLDGELWNVPFDDGICEDVASGRAVTSLFSALSNPLNVEASQPGVSPRVIAELAANGDQTAQECFARLGTNIARVLISVSSAFQPDAIVIGGNVAHASRWFAPSLKRQLQRAFTKAPIVRITRKYEISTLLGAASMALLPTPDNRYDLK